MENASESKAPEMSIQTKRSYKIYQPHHYQADSEAPQPIHSVRPQGNSAFRPRHPAQL